MLQNREVANPHTELGDPWLGIPNRYLLRPLTSSPSDNGWVLDAYISDTSTLEMEYCWIYTINIGYWIFFGWDVKLSI